MQVQLRSQTYTVNEVRGSDKVSTLYTKMSAKASAVDYSLQYSGHILEPDKLLSDYNIARNSVLQAVERGRGGALLQVSTAKAITM